MAFKQTVWKHPKSVQKNSKEQIFFYIDSDSDKIFGQRSSITSPKVVIYVHDVGQQRLGDNILLVQILHLLVHQDGFPGDFLAWSFHPEKPGEPL